MSLAAEGLSDRGFEVLRSAKPRVDNRAGLVHDDDVRGGGGVIRIRGVALRIEVDLER